MLRTDIASILEPIRGATFAALDTQTKVPLTGGKKNPHQGRIFKRCLGNRVMLFTNTNTSGYENMVQRRLEQAGLDPATFEAGKLPWGCRVPQTPFIDHNGNLYLQCVFLGAGDIDFFLRDNRDGEFLPIAKSEIIGLSDKTGSEHQGLERDRQVVVRTYAIDSITAIRCFGKEQEDLQQRDIALWARG